MARKTTGTARQGDMTTMEVCFSGPAVESHSMSVRDLAPALLGLSDAIDRYKELSHPLLDLDVRITATRRGSFDVLLQLLGTATGVVQGTTPADVTQLTAGLMDVIRILLARYHLTRTPAGLAQWLRDEYGYQVSRKTITDWIRHGRLPSAKPVPGNDGYWEFSITEVLPLAMASTR